MILQSDVSKKKKKKQVMNKQLIVLVLAILLPCLLWAQGETHPNKLILRGKVVDEKGKKVDGAEVALFLFDSKITSQQAKKGKFEVKLEMNQKYKVQFSKGDYTTRHLTIDTYNVPPERAMIGFEMQMEVALYKVTPEMNLWIFEEPIMEAGYSEVINSIIWDNIEAEQRQDKVKKALLGELKREAPIEEKETQVVPISEDTTFILPSATQLALILFKNEGIYNEQLKPKSESIDSYTNENQKVIGFGTWFFHLMYSTLKEETSTMLTSMAGLKRLADELKWGFILQEEHVAALEKNVDNRDSVLYAVILVAERFEDYIDENELNDQKALFAMGAVVEAMYVSSQSALQTKNTKLQQTTIEYCLTIKGLVQSLKKEVSSSAKWTSQLEELNQLVSRNLPDDPYAEVKVAEADFQLIAEKIKSIRNQLFE
jgi:hypothetical protein